MTTTTRGTTRGTTQGTTARPSTRRQALGAYGERVATRHLVAQGMVVLDRNWRCEEGELDIVLREGRVLVACEVKTRSSLDHGSPHEAVDDAKLDRLCRLLERWIQSRGVYPPERRIDLVAVLQPGRGPALVEHVRGIG